MSMSPMQWLRDEIGKLHEENAELLSSVHELAAEIETLSKRVACSEEMGESFLGVERWLHDEMERHEMLSANRDAKTELRLKELCRREGETHRQADRRLFSEIEPAGGALRVYQLACAKLMSELDAVLGELGIDYWFSCGTLIAAHYRAGAIPWDDDIDVYLPADGISRLREHLDGPALEDEDVLGHGFQVTTVYDRIACCKQMRFSSRGDLPCFIDLSPMEFTCAASPSAERRMHELRASVVADIEECRELDYWRRHPFLYAEGSGRCEQVIDDGFDDVDPVEAQGQIGIIEGIFSKWREIARNEGILAENWESAKGVAQAIDQIYTRRYIWDLPDIFPTMRMPYEGYMFSVPAQPEKVCQGCYPGSPYLPDDIIGHDHIRKSRISGAKLECLRKYVEDGMPV